MCNPDFFEQFIGFGNAGESLTFNYLTLSAFKVDPAPLARLGLLRERTIGSRIECAGCGAFAPISPRMEEDGITLYADCPECGRYRLSPLESKLWQVDFTPLQEVARTALKCSGTLSETVPDALWSLGRAALAGQSREVFACAGINTVRNADILANLPQGKTPLLLVIGNAPRPEKLVLLLRIVCFCFPTWRVSRTKKSFLMCRASRISLAFCRHWRTRRQNRLGKTAKSVTSSSNSRRSFGNIYAVSILP